MIATLMPQLAEEYKLTAPNGGASLHLSLGGFTLAHSSPAAVLRDDDELRVAPLSAARLLGAGGTCSPAVAAERRKRWADAVPAAEPAKRQAKQPCDGEKSSSDSDASGDSSGTSSSESSSSSEEDSNGKTAGATTAAAAANCRGKAATLARHAWEAAVLFS